MRIKPLSPSLEMVKWAEGKPSAYDELLGPGPVADAEGIRCGFEEASAALDERST